MIPSRNHTRNRHRSLARGKHRSPGRAGHAIVPERPSGNAARTTQWRCRATLAAGRSGASVPAREEAAGARAAWSQTLNQPPARPRCSRDAGTPGTPGTPSASGVPEGRCSGKPRQRQRTVHHSNPPSTHTARFLRAVGGALRLRGQPQERARGETAAIRSGGLDDLHVGMIVDGGIEQSSTVETWPPTSHAPPTRRRPIRLGRGLPRSG